MQGPGPTPDSLPDWWQTRKQPRACFAHTVRTANKTHISPRGARTWAHVLLQKHSRDYAGRVAETDCLRSQEARIAQKDAHGGGQRSRIFCRVCRVVFFWGDLKPTPKRPRNDPKATPKRPQSDPETTPTRKRPENDPKTTRKRPEKDQNRPKTSISGRFRVDFRSISGRFRVDFGSTSGRFRAYFGSISGRFWVDFGSISGRCRVDFRAVRGRFRVDFGWISGPFRVDLLPCACRAFLFSRSTHRLLLYNDRRVLECQSTMMGDAGHKVLRVFSIS